MRSTRIILPVVALLLGAALASARPPEGAPADPALHDWFQSLKLPGTPFSCCSMADCRPTDYRLGQSGYEAFLDDKWVPVPQEKVLVGYSNPVGRAVVCRTPNGTILCFVPASET
ncbi:MAG TPA: hypothetical protein VME45_08690 [Stellaceae bacterium]|nr:hypothetical protein [Stellaceae bacterium]